MGKNVLAEEELVCRECEFLENKHCLQERVKELNCLYAISKIIETPGISEEGILEGIIDAMIVAWQYSDITCVKLTVNGRDYTTDNFQESLWQLSSDIMINDIKEGEITVCYLAEKPEIFEGPFLKEERDLLDVIAERTGKIIARIRSEEKVKELTNEIMRLQEKERQRISKDLHDSISQALLAAKLHFKHFQRESNIHNEKFKRGVDLVENANRELREIYTDLYPSVLNDNGFEAAIGWCAQHYLEINSIDVNLDFYIKEDMEKEIMINLYRIIQEVFANILKHSGATKVGLDIFYENSNNFQLDIKDNGKGFNKARVYRKKEGFGLSNIKQRSENLGCTMELFTDLGAGTCLIISKSSNNDHHE